LNFSPTPKSAIPLDFLIESRLYGEHNLGYQASLPGELSMDWNRILEQLISSVRKIDVELYKLLFLNTTADRVLQHLMHEREESLVTLLESKPLDPLSLIQKLPEPAHNLEEAIAERKELDVRLVSIRKNCVKFRRLMEQIHNNCLEGEARKVLDLLDEWNSSQPSKHINELLIDGLVEFSSDRTARLISSEVDSRLTKEVTRRSTIERMASRIADIRLAFSGVTLAASYLGLTGRLVQALTVASTATFIPAATARLMRSSIKILPGFDLYAAFQSWPKLNDASP
jgi:hypothetical protein